MKKLLSIVVVIVILGAGAAIGLLYLAPEKMADIGFNLTRSFAGLEKKTLTLPDGETYVYLEGGEGEPLLLLHGFGANKDNYTFVAGHLTDTYHIIAPDHIGFGESSRPAGVSYSAIPQAKRLRQFVQHLGLSKIHIGGSSMGGHIAMTYAALYPDEVKSMWLLDPGGVWSAPKSELHDLLKEGTNPLIAKNADEFAKVYDFVMSKPPFIPRPILNVMAQERIDNIELEKKIFKEIKADSVEKRIAGLKIPALIVWGDEDRAINVGTAHVLHKLLPNSEVIIMKGIGHLPMVEAPRTSARDYLKFRAGL